jgi:hypothetical protein
MKVSEASDYLVTAKPFTILARGLARIRGLHNQLGEEVRKIAPRSGWIAGAKLGTLSWKV